MGDVQIHLAAPGLHLFNLPVDRLLLGVFIVSSFIAGCGTSSPPPRTGSQSTSPASANIAEGTIVSVEEGFLLIDLADGSRQEVGTDEAVMPIDKLLPAKGRRCRVHYRSEAVEEIDGTVRTALVMTKFEWL